MTLEPLLELRPEQEISAIPAPEYYRALVSLIDEAAAATQKRGLPPSGMLDSLLLIRALPISDFVESLISLHPIPETHKRKIAECLEWRRKHLLSIVDRVN